jgi:preprotein translocase subunit SecA
MTTRDRLKGLIRRLAGDRVQFNLEPYRARLEAVNAMAPQLGCASDAQLHERAQALRQRARTGAVLDDLLIEVFALVREVAQRTIGLRPFDVQILGGIGLHEGKIVQMGTGEGKTLVAVSPVALHALGELGVHVLTFNDYLARRDAEWMGPIYRFLGLTVGFVQQGMGRAERRNAYQADVTYLTAKEAGFDFLRDGLAYEAAELVQRPFHVAVVDEADSILIDEARVPLVIAGATVPHQGRQDLVRAIVQQLEPGLHFATDEYRRNVYLTDEGTNRAEELLGGEDLYAPVNLPLLTELNLALHAKVLMQRDVDYIVRRDRVEIVDEFTGRVVEDRHWPDGLQAAIEAKEGVRPSDEGRVLGSISLQHFLQGYPHLCGMTATAEPAADELFGFYGLEVLAVPAHRPCIRTDHPDLVFTHREAKRRALLAEIEQVHRTGRPILVGTVSVDESEGLAAELRAAGIGCNVLNAKRDAEEARIVAEAGALGTVTISTNMAGRGVDIRLGGSAGGGYERVTALGGLYVMGTNRHESRRIDDQLRGRAGRQGDPGSSRFFISLEDELLVRYGIDDLIRGMSRPTVQLEPVDSPILRRAVAQAQRIVEGQNFDIRLNLWRYSRFVEQQRRVFSEQRRAVLMGTDPPGLLRERAPEAYERARRALGEATLQDLERRLTLQAIDECWAEHLGTVAEIREGIHLAEVGGMSPLEEFQKGAAASFVHARDSVDAWVVERFASLKIASDGVDMEGLGLRGPSSTWTYLVNDDAFSDRMAATLLSRRNIGFAANAALTGPLLLVWALSRRLGRRGKQ